MSFDARKTRSMRSGLYRGHVTVGFFCLLVFSFEALADSYRCGRKIVRSGDSVSHLIQVCGEPRLKGAGSGVVEVDGVSRRVKVQRWYYRQGARSLEHVVLIYRDEIAAIEVVGR